MAIGHPGMISTPPDQDREPRPPAAAPPSRSTGPWTRRSRDPIEPLISRSDASRTEREHDPPDCPNCPGRSGRIRRSAHRGEWSQPEEMDRHGKLPPALARALELGIWWPDDRLRPQLALPGLGSSHRDCLTSLQPCLRVDARPSTPGGARQAPHIAHRVQRSPHGRRAGRHGKAWRTDSSSRFSCRESAATGAPSRAHSSALLCQVIEPGAKGRREWLPLCGSASQRNPGASRSAR